MRIKKIYISAEIQDLLVTSKRFYAQLFLLGKNKVGVFVKALPLPKTSGCEMMPGIRSSALAKAYICMLKDDEIQGLGFGYRTSHESGLTSDIFKFPDIPFICSTDGDLSATVAYEDRNGQWQHKENVEVHVVDKNYDPAKGRIIKKGRR